MKNSCDYTYRYIQTRLNKLKKIIPHFSIGKTTLGRDIVCFVLGSNLTTINDKGKNSSDFNKFVAGNNNLPACGKTILIQCSIHAREHLTTVMALKHIEFLSHFKFEGTIYYIPLVNIDGVSLALQGLRSAPKEYHKNLLKINKNGDFSLFKANLRGVDLNTNFDADFGKGSQNIHSPAPANYIGIYPHSEKETKAVLNITQKIMPDITLSYHCKGEIIYYGFNSKLNKTEKRYLKIIKNQTHYKPIYTKNSAGGFKDYCLQTLNIPSYTIEIGSDILNHPLPLSEALNAFTLNKFLPLLLLQ